MRQSKGKDPKKVNTLEVNGEQYKDSKRIANKISDTIAELSFPQKLQLKLFRIETKGKIENYTVNHNNKENYGLRGLNPAHF